MVLVSRHSQGPLYLTVLCIATLGCAGKGALVEPPLPSPTAAVRTAADSSRRAFAGAQVHLDLVAGTADLLPLRTTQAGTQDVLEAVDATQFVNISPCLDCLKVVGVGHSAVGNPTLSIAVRHPFASPAATTFQNQNFSVFNVEGVVVFDEADATLTSFPGVSQSAVTLPRLLNADGLSGALDGSFDTSQVLTTATLHPYRLFYRDYSAGTYDALSAQGFPDYADVRGFLSMGQGKGPDIQTYEFVTRPGDSSLDFTLLLEASFGQSAAGKPEVATPEYRCPQYNKKSASEVHAGLRRFVTGDVGGLGLVASDATSESSLQLRVLDINDASTGVSVGPNREQLRASSNVSALTIDIPDVLSVPITLTDPSVVLTGGVGNDPANPLTYSIPVLNTEGAPAGAYVGLVRVADSYPTGLNTAYLEDGLGYGGSPGATTYVPVDEMATYQLFPVTVSPAALSTLTAPIPAAGDQFGTSLATADFNGDGLIDLAIGAHESTAGGQLRAGKVYVSYQLPTGELSPSLALNEAVPQSMGLFGFTLGAGDVNGDGRADLLVGAGVIDTPGRVIYYRSTGASFTAQTTLTDPLLLANSRFGFAINTARIDSDGLQDILIGAPSALGAAADEGKVYVYRGTSSSPVTLPQLVPPDSQTGGQFGFALTPVIPGGGTNQAVGLAVGYPGFNGAIGRVYLFDISGGAIEAVPSALDPANAGAKGFGASLTSTDLTGDGLPDLIVGAPGVGASDSGRIDLFYLDALGANFLAGPLLTISDSASFSFGQNVVVGDFSGSGLTDIASAGFQIQVGIPTAAGRVAIFPDALPTGLNRIEISEVFPAMDERYGRALAVLPGVAGRPDRLVVGVPGESPGGQNKAGVALVY